MSSHPAKIVWKRTEAFDYESYNRGHDWLTPFGLSIPMSAAVEYKGTADRTNPEEALVAALSSCHMLTFLAIAARKKLTVESYEDEAEGILDKNEDGRLAVTEVTLRPRVVFSGEAPDAPTVEKLHASAHRNCFIANSVKCSVSVAPRSRETDTRTPVQ